MRYKLALLFMLTCFFQFPAQESGGLVKWLTFKEAQEKNKEVKKPFLIDFYTDWCGWCKHMMRTTYSNEALAGYINTNFYPVKFDAETKDTIEYNGVVYKPLSPEPRVAHELTIKFLGNKLSYPSTVFVTNNYEYNLLSQGYLDEKKIEPLLIFMTENVWQTTQYDEFAKHFEHTFNDTVFPKKPVVFTKFSDVDALAAKKPKKFLIDLGADFCNSCMVMKKTTFSDSAVAAVLNKYFYLLDFNAASPDTVVWKGRKHALTNVNNFSLNSLALEITGGRFSIPALCILDEKKNLIDVLNYYQSPQRLAPILEFIGSDAYKTEKFNDFMQKWLTEPKAKAPKKATAAGGKPKKKS